MNDNFVDTVGWYGAIAIVASFLLERFSILGKGNIVLALLTITGAIALVVFSIRKKAYPPAIVFGGWVIVTLLAAIGVTIG